MVFHTDRNKCTATYECCHSAKSQVATIIATTLIEANCISEIDLNSHKAILSKKKEVLLDTYGPTESKLITQHIEITLNYKEQLTNIATNVATFLNPSHNSAGNGIPLVSLLPVINTCAGVSTVSPVQINKFKMLKKVLPSHLAYQPSQAYQKGGPRHGVAFLFYLVTACS